jgi:hypothetical protein
MNIWIMQQKKLHVITIYNNSKAVKKLCGEEKLLLNITA